MVELSVTNAVKKYLCPFMEDRGYRFYSTPSEGIWKFVKEGSKQQIVFVNRFLPHTLRLEFRLTPSFRHKHIEVEDFYLDRYHIQKGKFGGWEYHCQEELNKLVQCFAKVMEEVGFDIMENAVSDPLDIIPTSQMQFNLYYNHESLARQFADACNMITWEYQNVSDQLILKMLEYKEQVVNPENTDDLLNFAAAYGNIFEKLGAEWMLHQNECMLQIPRKDSIVPLRIYPLTVVFHFFHFGNSDNARMLLDHDMNSFSRCK